MAKKKPQTRVDLIKGDRSVELITGNIPDIINKLQALAATVPEEHRDKIEIEIDTFDYYGCTTISLDAYYYRDETKEERAERLEEERVRKEQQEVADRANFERLKKKLFGPEV